MAQRKFKKYSDLCDRIAGLPVAARFRGIALAAKALPSAIFGVEVTVFGAMKRTLRSKAAQALLKGKWKFGAPKLFLGS